jgi:hypothetical protein
MKKPRLEHQAGRVVVTGSTVKSYQLYSNPT